MSLDKCITCLLLKNIEHGNVNEPDLQSTEPTHASGGNMTAGKLSSHQHQQGRLSSLANFAMTWVRRVWVKT